MCRQCTQKIDGVKVLSFVNRIIGVICISIFLLAFSSYGTIHIHAYEYETPEGYSDNDYQKLLRFYLNGNQHLKWDIGDPAKWHGVIWDNSPDKCVMSINLHNSGISGGLDLSDFSQIYAVEVLDNKLTHLDVSNCPNIMVINCDNNQIKWIAGHSKLHPRAYVSATGNPNFTIVRSDIATDEIVDSFKSGEDSTFVLSEVITLDSDVFNSIPIGSSANFTIVNADDRFLYEWSFSNILPSSYCSSFNLSADLTPLNSDSAVISSLKLSGNPPPLARLKIDVSKHYRDGELLYIYKYSNNHCNEESSYLHSLTNLASNVEVRNGIIDFAPTGSEIVLSNLPLEIKESTTSTSTSASSVTTSLTTTITSATTTFATHQTSITTVTTDDSTTINTPSSPLDTEIEGNSSNINNENQCGYVKVSQSYSSTGTIDNTDATFEDMDSSTIKENNPSTYGRVGTLFLPLIFGIIIYLNFSNGRTKKHRV